MSGLSFASCTLSELATFLGGTLLNVADPFRRATSLACDHSKVQPEGVFVAIDGAKFDGHDVIAGALKNGACVAVVSNASKLKTYSGILVPDTRRALSQLSSLFAGHPSEKLCVVGITGTNGKTTTNWLLYHVFNQIGLKSIRIGTLGVKAEGIIDRAGVLTTPDPIQLHADMRQALDGGAESCVMEVSSHSLHQRRVDDVRFDVGVFTNLTRDHLDYHRDMEDYFSAKCRLFQLIGQGNKQTKGAIINSDASYGERFASKATSFGCRVFSFGRSTAADIRIVDFKQSVKESIVELSYRGSVYKIRTSLIGEHNAENLATVFAVLMALNKNPEQVIPAIEKAPLVPGRLEPVKSPEIGVFVDYAHTPDALDNVLKALRPLVRNKLWVVFGCGGDRDKGKRPQMAEVASKLADRLIVTSDNPRSEDPQSIINDILKGGINPIFVEIDRRAAIQLAVESAEPGDIVLIAGKGHEDYQIIGEKKSYFSDVEEANLALRKRYA